MTSQLQFTIELTKQAGAMAMQGMNKIRQIKSKTVVRDVCSNVDLEVENLIVRTIRKRFPGHNIIREEEKNIEQGSAYTWIIDPIDGTKYFVKGIKFFTTSVGLWHKNKPLLGAVYQPGTNDLWWAEKGKGAYLNNKKIKISKIDKLADSIITVESTHINKLSNESQKRLLKRLEKIMKSFYRFRFLGVGSLSLCWLAQGHFEAYFDISGRQEMKDLGAGLIIAKETGAKITNLAGKWPGLNASHLVVANGKIHQQFLKLMNQL